MIYSGLLYRLDMSTFYFYEPLLFQIVLPRKFMNIWPLSSIIFTVNRQADKHFYTYIYLFLLFQILYSNGLQKKLKMVYMVHFKWSTEKSL